MTDYLSWNRLPKLMSQKYHLLKSSKLPKSASETRFLAQGNRRSYGDVCLSETSEILLTTGLDKLMSFDVQTGLLRAQAGVLLRDILNFTVPQGWFLTVTPSTAMITLGGAIANDVYGKNHHLVGSFGNHVKRLTLVRSNGEKLECSQSQNQGLFLATIGGLGLTGLIADAEIQLKRIHNPLIWCENRSFANLDEYWQLSQKDLPYSVAWVDCASKNDYGRGIMMYGQHAPAQNYPFIGQKRQWKMPIDPPFSLVQGLTVKAFNQVYYQMNKQARSFISDYRPYFYPLDTIDNWRVIYGSGGFYQYQCVIPPNEQKEGIKALLDEIQKSGQGSFLAVLKTFGEPASLGYLSFPRQGTTLALDFPNKGEKTLKLFERLDAIVRETRGALYPAKDARMSGEMFRMSFPRWQHWAQHLDPRFSSHFLERIS